jgi:hypothetical protein
MFKRLVLVGILASSVVLMLNNESMAQYNYLGGGWWFGTYHNSITFTVPGNDQKNYTILFVSDTTWYDNLIVCKNKGGNITYSPGIGMVSKSGTVVPISNDECIKNGKCTGEVDFPNQVSDFANGGFGCTGDPQQCFLDFFSLNDFHCRNKNDTPVQVLTKGVCTIASAETCDSSGCFAQADQGVRFSFNSFNPPPGALFNMVRDDTCIACVNGDTNSCTPAS